MLTGITLPSVLHLLLFPSSSEAQLRHPGLWLNSSEEAKAELVLQAYFWNVAHLWVKYLEYLQWGWELECAWVLASPFLCPVLPHLGWGAAAVQARGWCPVQARSFWVQLLALCPVCDFIYLSIQYLSSGTVSSDSSLWNPACWEQRLSLCAGCGCTVQKAMH